MDENEFLLVFILVRFILGALCLGISAFLFYSGQSIIAGWFLFFGFLFGYLGFKSGV